MAVRKGNHSEIRVLAAGSRIDSDKKTSVEVDSELNRFVKHLFQKRLFKTLVDAVESNATHFGVDQIRPVAHDNFQASVFVGVLPPWNQMLHMQTVAAEYESIRYQAIQARQSVAVVRKTHKYHSCVFSASMQA